MDFISMKMQVNINGVSSKLFSITGLLILILGIATNNWRKKDINGRRVTEGVWDDCATHESAQLCYLNKREQGKFLMKIVFTSFKQSLKALKLIMIPIRFACSGNFCPHTQFFDFTSLRLFNKLSTLSNVYPKWK